jgi:sterol desaturase/sphingolipid hydroxylase (fatty acid hydroxylase superfamily)
MNWTTGIYAVVIIEQIVLLVGGRFNPRRALMNFTLGAIPLLLTSPLLSAPVQTWAVGHALWTRPIWMKGIAFIAVDFVILDFLRWFMHWAAHRCPPLWRLHSVHHTDVRLDFSTEVRHHPVEKIYKLATRALLIVVFAIPLESIVIADGVAFVHGYLQHVDFKVPLWVDRTLGKIFCTPSFHRVHHARYLPYTDSNYGVVFSIFDRLFGTVSVPRPLPGMTFGLDDHGEFGLLESLVGPFTSWYLAGPPPVPRPLPAATAAEAPPA